MVKKLRRRGSRGLKLTPELEAALNDQVEAFRQKFGRDPHSSDPIFFDPHADEPRPWSQATVATAEAAFVEAARKAGLNEALTYAFRKTGRIVTEENARHLSAEDLKEWQAAVEEHRALKREGH